MRSWVDHSLYPFEPKWFDADRWKISYVDEGTGPPVVFVHGTPGWSFQYRETIKGLTSGFRCLAPDNLGFGLSDKPTSVTYRPDKQAEYFEAFVSGLGLKDISLVLHDHGGPIGLSYAIRHPENVRHIVLMNTWMWPLKGNPKIEKLVKFANGPIGRFLYVKRNYGIKYLMPLQLQDRSKFTKSVREHYTSPFAQNDHRQALLGYANALTQSNDWYQSLWNQRDVLKSIPTQIFWGMKDHFFDADTLERWTGLWPEAEVHRLQHTGHYVPEEHGADIVAFMHPFLKDMAAWHTSPQVI